MIAVMEREHIVFERRIPVLKAQHINAEKPLNDTDNVLFRSLANRERLLTEPLYSRI